MTGVSFIKTIKDSKLYLKNILIVQPAFPAGKITERQLNNFKVYKSQTAWDLPLPSILIWQKPDIELRDSATLKSGFRNKQKDQGFKR